MYATEIAKYFLWKGAQDEDNDMSNLKLQKLLYYGQGFHLAMFDKGCFDDDIVAWPHGPVVISVYEEYKAHGSNVVPAPSEFDPTQLDESLRETLDEVYDVYGQFSAWRLREMTHEESPWKETPQHGVIQPNLMREFFLTRVREA